MRPLADKVKRGKLKEHPFGEDKSTAAAKYIAQIIHSTIEKVAKRPAAVAEAAPVNKAQIIVGGDHSGQLLPDWHRDGTLTSMPGELPWRSSLLACLARCSMGERSR
jgi:hypothetical protein